jgi:hypothetical protein
MEISFLSVAQRTVAGRELRSGLSCDGGCERDAGSLALGLNKSNQILDFRLQINLGGGISGSQTYTKHRRSIVSLRFRGVLGPS